MYIPPFKFIIAWGACKIPYSICWKPVGKINPKLTLSTRSPLKQVRSPSGAPPEPLEIQGGAPQVPFCFRLESAATHEGILCGKLPPCYVVAINYQPTGHSSGYSRATRQACIFLTHCPLAQIGPFCEHGAARSFVFLYLFLPGKTLLPSIRLITRFCGRPLCVIHVPDLHPRPRRRYRPPHPRPPRGVNRNLGFLPL